MNRKLIVFVIIISVISVNILIVYNVASQAFAKIELLEFRKVLAKFRQGSEKEAITVKMRVVVPKGYRVTINLLDLNFPDVPCSPDISAGYGYIHTSFSKTIKFHTEGIHEFETNFPLSWAVFLGETPLYYIGLQSGDTVPVEGRLISEEGYLNIELKISVQYWPLDSGFFPITRHKWIRLNSFVMNHNVAMFDLPRWNATYPGEYS